MGTKVQTPESGHQGKPWGWSNGNGYDKKQSSWSKEGNGSWPKEGTSAWSKEGSWSCTTGWWFEGARNGRAVASSALVPQPQATLSVDGKALLKSHSIGVHVANASPAGPASISFAVDAAVDSVMEWAD